MSRPSTKWMWVRIMAALVVGLVVAGCSSAPQDPIPPSTVPLRVDRTPPYGPAGMEPSSPSASVAPTPAAYRLRSGDAIVVTVRTPAEQQFEMIVDEHGMIKLPLIPDIRAAGLTGSELERFIKNSYISNQIYRNVTVNVLVPQRSYFVRGEVRSPGRYPLTGSLTLLQAIAAAGGYTDFANPRRIQILRGGTTMTLDGRDPEQDIAVETGDVIIVPRSVF